MSLIQKAKDLPIKKTISALIAGSPASGKTTLALSAPKPLLFDLEGGIYRVRADHRRDSVQVEKFEEVIEVLSKEDLSDYDSIVFDSLGRLSEKIMDKVLRDNPNMVMRDGSPSLKAWGVAKQEYKKMKLLVEKLNKTLIYVAHIVEKEIDGETVCRVDCSGSMAKDIIKDIDILGFMELIGKKRTISFTPCQRYYAKNSLGLKSYIEIPYLEENETNDFLNKNILLPTIEKRKNEFKTLEENKEKMNKAIEIINTLGDTPESREQLNALNLNKEQVLRAKELLKNK